MLSSDKSNVGIAECRCAGWWGAKRFTSAGCLEGLEKQKDTASKERQEFNEADQEALYNSTQNAKTEHKKGLGAHALMGELPVLGLQC